MKKSKKLSSYIAEFESYIPQYETSNHKVSKSTVGWQIDHSLKVINMVTHAVKESNPKNFKNNTSFIGKLLLTLGKFPRGRAKAPKQVRPPEVITKDELLTQIEQAKNSINNVENIPVNAYFNHPLFGHINTKKVNRFLEIHSKHHLKIIRDILNVRQN